MSMLSPLQWIMVKLYGDGSPEYTGRKWTLTELNDSLKFLNVTEPDRVLSGINEAFGLGYISSQSVSTYQISPKGIVWMQER